MQLSAGKKHTYAGHDGALYSLGNSINPSCFLTAGSDKVVVEWNLNSEEPKSVLARTPGVIYCTCIVPEFGLLLVGTDHGGIHVIDLEKKAEVRYLLAHKTGVFDILWNPFTEEIVAAGGDGILTIWNVHNFHCKATIELGTKKLRGISLCRESGLIAVSRGDNKITTLSSLTHDLIKTWDAHDSAVYAICFDPTGKYLLSGGKDAHLKVWETEDFELVNSIPAHNYAIYSIAYHPGEKLFATASRDKTVKLWNADNFDFLLRIDKANYDGHINSVNRVIWSGSDLISCSDDRTAIGWNVELF